MVERRERPRRRALLGGSLLTLCLSGAVLVAPARAAEEAPATGLEEASFVDPTAQVRSARSVELGHRVYVGPFAQLLAAGRVGIEIGAESNVQDSVRVDALVPRWPAEARALAAAGLHTFDGVEVGERVILAHGSAVRGPARIGADHADPRDSGVFISFGALVDGAVLERDTGLSALSRVGPGVVLRSGTMVLPGKDVRTQAEADDPALGKVRPLVEADRLFNAAVVEVNTGLAREYSRLAAEDPQAVHGINVDPGGNVFDASRDAPTVESALCTGPEVREPGFRNRVIGDVCFEDDLATLDARMGSRISLRADEGGPFSVGTVRSMGNETVFHALEGSDLSVGNRVTYGEGVVVHGGGRPTVDPTTGTAAPTTIGNDVVLGDGSVVFRSLLRNGAVVGERSAVVATELEVGQVVPDRTVYANDEVFGAVEW
ncbi:acetyltransferase [Kineococcus esterisolvens]|uniref:acetyltransferase n=1 Tax=unclassified Kineococcus TaxID=2621656 RepID=UPI003D7C7160